MMKSALNKIMTVCTGGAIDEQLRLQDRVAQAMKTLRHQHGALTLDTGEARAVWDGEIVTDLRGEAKNRARELIEGLMVAANGVTARYLEAKGFPALRRVLKAPERWPRIVALAATFGESLPAEPNAPALQEFLPAVLDQWPPRRAATGGIRRQYSDNDGS